MPSPRRPLRHSLLARAAGLGFVLATAAATSCALRADTGGGDARDRTLSISGAAEIEVIPDEAIVAITFSTTDVRMQVAHQKTQKAVESFLTELAGIGISRDATSLGSVVYNPNFIYPDDRPEKLVSFTASVESVVKTRDFTKIAAIIDTAVTAGATNVGGVQFYSTRLPELKKQVRDKALQATREKAEQIATGLGAKLGPVKDVAETAYDSYVAPPRYRRYDDPYGMASSNVAVQARVSAPEPAEPRLEGPMSPGSFPLRLAIQATYYLE